MLRPTLSKLTEKNLDRMEANDPVSVEARRALDAHFLRRRDQKRLRQLVKPIFDRTKRVSIPDKPLEDEGMRRSLLLEIAKIATILANSDQQANPGRGVAVQDSRHRRGYHVTTIEIRERLGPSACSEATCASKSATYSLSEK